jgi:PEP-CTERM motif-containing protein
MNRTLYRSIAAAAFACSFCLLVPLASASVIGDLKINGGTVTVSIASLTWSSTPTAPTVDGISTLTYGPTNTLLAGGTVVNLANLPPGSLPLDGFMTFVGVPTLDFILDTIGPGSSNTDCTVAGLSANSGDCSVVAGVPIVLSQQGTGTLASLALTGTVTDGSSPASNWIGLFSETIVSLPNNTGIITPLEVQQYFGGPSNPNGNALSESYSGSFAITITPEPSTLTMMMLGSGLVLAALKTRRKHSR